MERIALGLVPRTALSKTEHANLRTAYIADLTFCFSYDTLIAFGVPGLGFVKARNVWSPMTGRHLNSIPARYSNVSLDDFYRATHEVERMIGGYGTRAGAIKRIERMLAEYESK